jgi:mRNA interferase MazF
MAVKYVPDAGDLIWLNFTPQAGHEQAGKRPALVVSSKQYNGIVGLAIICPITKQIKGFPFEVQLSEKGKVKGVVLSDQIKNIDWKARKAEYVEKINKNIFNEVIQKALTLIKEIK